MASYKEISSADNKSSRSALNQLVDIVQEDISGSVTRRKYQVWVSGSTGPGVTSSLFQTIYDQDFSLQTSNPIFDFTVGLYFSGSTVQDTKTGEDSAGKLLFPSTSLMMREKVDVYRQFAQQLIGNAESAFFSTFGSTTSTDQINEAIFINFKRLFARDKIKRETFAMRFYQSASHGHVAAHAILAPNLDITSTGSQAIFTDLGAAANRRTTFGGEVADVVDSSNTATKVGLVFYDAGIVVLDANKVMQGDQYVSGVIDAMSANSTYDQAGVIPGAVAGKAVIGSNSGHDNPNATFIPDFFVSASMDNIIDYLAQTRFQSGTLTAQTFQNVTNINSTLIFCRATADEFNYSSNPTYTDSSDRIIVIDEGQEDTQSSFTFITTVGLYDVSDNLLAVAKLSRPIEKNKSKDLSIRIRLDF